MCRSTRKPIRPRRRLGRRSAPPSFSQWIHLDNAGRGRELMEKSLRHLLCPLSLSFAKPGRFRPVRLLSERRIRCRGWWQGVGIRFRRVSAAFIGSSSCTAFTRIIDAPFMNEGREPAFLWTTRIANHHPRVIYGAEIMSLCENSICADYTFTKNCVLKYQPLY